MTASASPFPLHAAMAELFDEGAFGATAILTARLEDVGVGTRPHLPYDR